MPDGLQTIDIANSPITPSVAVKNLGVMFDCSLAMDKHITAMCKKAFFEIHNISRVRKYLTVDATKSLVHSYVMSKLDYCNALLYNLPKYQLDKLQRLMNCAARLISRTEKSEHITPILQSLHWLPFPERIIFKLCLLTFKCLHGKAPSYLTDLLKIHQSSRTLRSNDQMLLDSQRTRLKQYGDRAFVKAAPTLWNKLPLDLRMCADLTLFKMGLKTFLFKQAYNV